MRNLKDIIEESLLDDDWREKADDVIRLKPWKNMFDSPEIFEKKLYELKSKLGRALTKSQQKGWMFMLDFGWDAQTLTLTDGVDQTWLVSRIRREKDLFIQRIDSNPAWAQVPSGQKAYKVTWDFEPLRDMIVNLTPTSIIK